MVPIKDFEFSLDLARRSVIPRMEFYSGSHNASTMTITLTNDHEITNLTNTVIEILYDKPDKTQVINTNIEATPYVEIIDFTNGIVKITLTTQALTCKGRVKAQIKVIDGEDTSIYPEFTFTVGESIDDTNTIVSSNEMPLLEDLIGGYATAQRGLAYYDWTYTAPSDNITSFAITSSDFNPVKDQVDIYDRNGFMYPNINYTRNNTIVILTDYTLNTGGFIFCRILKDVIKVQVKSDGSMLTDGTVGKVKLTQDVQNDLNSVGDLDYNGITESTLAEAVKNDRVQIANNLKRYTDFVIDVVYCNGNTDVDKFRNAVALAIGLKTTNICYIKSSKILTINSSVLLDFNDSTGIMIDISFTPTAGIGDAITLYGGKNIVANFNIINGGGASDYGVTIRRMVESKVTINGRACLSTLFKSNGTGTEISYGMQVGIKNYQCGQTMEVGVNGTYASGFGEFEYVWEEKSLRGSVVQNMYDITFKHYENHIVDATHTVTSLLLKNVYGSNFGVLSLGGKAKNLVTFQDSTISIGRLHLGSEDVYDDSGNYNASLAKITDGAYVTGVSNLFVEHMYTTHLNNILIQTAKQNIDMKRVQTNGDENAFVVKDGVNLNYPINAITAYKSYIDNKFSDTKVQTIFRDKCTTLNKQTGGSVVPNVYRETDSNTFVLDSTIFNNNDQSIKMVQPSASRAQVILDVNFTAGLTYMLETNFKAQGFATDTEFEIFMEYRNASSSLATGWYMPFKVHTNDGFYLDNIRLIGKIAPAGTTLARLVFYLTKNSATSPQVNIDGLTIKAVS